MKKTILSLLILLTGFNSLLKAQSSIGIDNSMFSYIYNDTTSFNNTDFYKVQIKNFGPQTYTGSIEVVYAVDSSTVGFAYVPLFVDSSNIFLPVGTNVADSAYLPINVGAFRSGINTVVIWPRMSSTSNPFTIHDSLKLSVWVLGTAGIHSQTLSEQPIVFPNPMQQLLFIENRDKNFNIEQVRIFDTAGKLVYSGIFKGSIDVSKLAAGSYTLEFSDKTGKSSRYKVIKE